MWNIYFFQTEEDAPETLQKRRQQNGDKFPGVEKYTFKYNYLICT